MQFVGAPSQFDELSRIADSEMPLSPVRTNSLSTAVMGQVLWMQDAISDLLPSLPQRVSLSLRRAVVRHSQALLDPAHDKAQTVHCFTLIRDVLRLVAEESADVVTVLTVVNDLDELLFELQAE
jgi:hypothetical protein